MESPFFNNDFDSILRINVISALYPDLIQPHKDILLKYLRQLVLVVSMIYNFNSNKSIFMHELTQNNHQDLKWLCSFLLNHLESQHNIKSFDDIYHKKLKDIDINEESPKYLFSNLQYGRCIRGEKIKEIDFDESHMEHNFKILISSIIEGSHKLYINWMDVLPLTLNNYQEKELFKNSLDFMKKKDLKELNINNIIFNEENGKRLHSLQISDIYNVIRNYLYEDIIPLKLLIYDLADIHNNILIPSIQFFKRYFEEVIDEIMDENPWGLLNQTKKDEFEQKLNKLFEYALKRVELSLIIMDQGDNYSYTVSAASIQRLVKAMCITFDNTYRSSPIVIRSGYVPIKTEVDDEKEQDDEKVFDIYSIQDLKQQLDTIKPQFMYEHLRKLIERFKYTIYSSMILDPQKKKILDPYSETMPDLNLQTVRQVTLKNIYNFAKSISRYQKGKEYPAYPKHWKSLEKNEKTEILNKLNGKTPIDSWFNIKRYIRYVLKELKQDTTPVNVDRYNYELHKYLSETHLMSTIFKALIYKGVLSELKPNKDLTDTSISSRSERGDILSKVDKNIFNYDATNPYATAYSYLSELPYIYSGNIPDANRSGWFTLYALDWVSQIGFCHRYINQRISYVTGATGVGKSTQVPKLFMYYLKAIDYNSTGRVVCTQPRKAPTKKNADQVSKELGFPIFDGDKDTDYYFVQMHHKTQQHISNVSHLSLKYITDGTLVQEFKNVTPMLKKLNFDGSIANQNAYDIIIIDEAHEHGKNMDVLLTLMRDFCYFNPSIKLVILSATMDDDEPVYRRYYRDINDNQKFPIDCNLRDFNLDRVNVDRRYHISPVGLGTTHKIEETYLDGSNPVDIVRSLVRDGLRGDILIFQPGEADIIDLVEQLNENTPDDVIALPFYSALSDDKKTFIEDIDKTFPTLRMSKRDNYAKVRDVTKGPGSYKNCIICSTNIAEASITIRRLYYVIETGTRKGLIYSYTRRAGKLTTMNISESSRLQRKGRVGRTGPGHVYYTYKKGLMENNKILFEFSTGNVSDSIFSTIQEKLEENLVTTDNLLKTDKLKEQFNYLFNTSKGPFKYRGDAKLYDYDYIDRYFPKMYETGYDSVTLYDATGDFYIVHPEELYIKRNIMGKIKSSIRQDVICKDDKLESYKMNSFFEDLFMKKYLDMKSDKYYRTQFGKLINEIILASNCFEDQNLAEILSYSVFFNTTDEMCRIMSMIAALNGNMLTMFNVGEKMTYDLKSFKSIFNKSKSEFDVLNQLGMEITKYVLKEISIDEIDENVMRFFKLDSNSYYEMINDYKNIEMEDDSGKKKLSRESIYLARVQSILNHPKLNAAINSFGELLDINAGFIGKFLEFYFISTDNIKSLYFPNKRNKVYTDDINKFKTIFEDEIKLGMDPILLNLLHAQPFNIAKRIIPTKYFLSLYAPSSENIYGLSMYKQKQTRGISFEPLLLIPNEYASNYIFYFAINILRESPVFISYIDSKYIKLFSHIYNYDRANKVGSTEFQKVDKYLEKLESKQIPQQIIMEDIRTLQHVGTTYKEMLTDLK